MGEKGRRQGGSVGGGGTVLVVARLLAELWWGVERKVCARSQAEPRWRSQVFHFSHGIVRV